MSTQHDEASDEKRARRRELLPLVFVAALIAIAYQEMVSTSRESFRKDGLTLETLFLSVIFFLTAMRFFVGNLLHLQSDFMRRATGAVWFYDLMIIIFQTTLFIYLGGLSSVEASRSSPVGFFWLLIVLYATDVLWILSQWLMGYLNKSWKREDIPWPWGILNTVLIILVCATYYILRDFYTGVAIVALGLFNLVGFVIDMLMVDRYKVL